MAGSSNAVGLAWYGCGGRAYEVFSTTNLLSDAWIREADLTNRDGRVSTVFAGTNAVISVIPAPVPEEPRRYFKLRARRVGL